MKALPDVGHLVLAEYSRNLPQDILDFLRENGLI
jgi:hypothetical protein